MDYESCSNAELIRIVVGTQAASSLERELAKRLDEVMTEIALISDHFLKPPKEQYDRESIPLTD